MKRILMTAIVMSASLLALFAESAKDIIDRMESVMDFDTLSFTAVIENTDRLGTVTQVFDTVRNGNGDTLMTVTSGMDRGQKILRLENEIYIYYPDADEVIRLSDSGLSGSFLGSDFSYEDLTGDDDYSQRYSYEVIGEEAYEGTECWRIRFTARKLSETYQRMEMLIDKDRCVPLAQELYSKSGKLLKTIFYDDYTSGPCFPCSVRTENAVKKSNRSVMTVNNIVFNTRVDDSLFDREEFAW
ncbi:MAG: outer membrane lipoprotein-sorting protein [Bullifex sp.]